MLYEFSHAPCVPNYYSFSFYLTISFSERTKHWSWSEGVYLAGWMRYQIFLPLFLLQLINLFWYYLIIRILVRLDIFLSYLFIAHKHFRAVRQTDVDDDRSDDESEGDNDKQD